ncbi:hypothetical protein ACWGH4_34960, partial [Streptomyces sp. NPDC054847]
MLTTEVVELAVADDREPGRVGGVHDRQDLPGVGRLLGADLPGARRRPCGSPPQAGTAVSIASVTVRAVPR